jgi:CRP-like cAMP-binding protein
MMKPQLLITNHVLTALPAPEFARLTPWLEPVSLAAGEVITAAGESARHVYFPEGAVLSYFIPMTDGKTAEVGMVGREGAAGLSTLFGAWPSARQVRAVVSGSALRVGVERLGREFEQSAALRGLLTRYVSEFLTQVMQRSACGHLHASAGRFATWLLLLGDRARADEVEFTQERMAQHMGLRRAGITMLCRELVHAGAIGHSRGRVRFLDRRLLAQSACECYNAMAPTGGAETAVPSHSQFLS